MEKKFPRMSTKRLVSLSVLVALALVVSKFSITIIPKQLVVSLTFVVNTIIGMVAGPLWAFISLAAIDVVDILSSGSAGQFIIWWTLLEATQGFFYGIFFYGKKLDWHNQKDWVHVTLATVVIMLIGTFIFTPLLIQIYYGVPFVAQFVAGRWLKIFEIPLRVLMTMILVPQLQHIPELRKLANINK